MPAASRLRLAVWKFASCDGCQLSLLNCEDELLEVAESYRFSNFAELSSAVTPGPYDVSLVEGSITTPHDAERIHRIRRESKLLVAVGACATAGGLQALRNWRDLQEMIGAVYSSPDSIDTLRRSTPISDHVRVDYELRGCPVDKGQLLEVLNALVHHREPQIRAHSVCIDCKARGNICVMVSSDIPCLGPVTHAGCRALCPSFGRGCAGCFGPKELPNVPSLMSRFSGLGMSEPAIRRSLRSYAAGAEPFSQESERHEDR